MNAREREHLEQAARAANQVAEKWSGLLGQDARDTTAVSRLMAARYIQQLNEQER